MKKIETYIRPDKFQDVQMALEKIGSPGMTVSDVRGHGVQKGVTQDWQGEKIKVSLLPKIRIETVVKDESVAKVVETILEAAQTGEAGDGKIFVTLIEQVYRVRTKESGEKSLS